MDYWEFEEYIKLMNERNKEENEKNKQQQEQQQEQQSSMMPKIQMPNFNSFKPGNFNMPKF
jgi:hypothetical protein